AGVVLEGQIQHQVGWHDAWVSGRQFVHEIGSLHLLHHVHTEAIVAKTDIDARTHHLFNGRTATSVVHVRARVVDATGTRFCQPANVAAVDVHTMSGNAARPQNMIGFQAHSHAHAITSHTVVFVRGIVCHVNMEAPTRSSASGGTASERNPAARNGTERGIASGAH